MTTPLAQPDSALSTKPRTRNVAAIVAFALWLLVIIGSIGSVVVGFLALDDTAANGLAPIAYPLSASMVIAPLAAIGLVVSIVAVSRRGRAKVLAIAALVLNALALLVVAPLFLVAVSA